MSPIDIEVSARDAAADLRLHEYETLEDLDEDVRLLVQEAGQGGCVRIGFHLEPAHPLIIPDAFAVVRAFAEQAEAKGLTIRCLVPSERIAEGLIPSLPGEIPDPRSFTLGATEIVIVVHDITDVRADAIVNASNTRLLLGGGVSRAIRRAAGPGLQDEMSAAAPISPGQVVVTGAHGLPNTKWILHAATASGNAEVIARAVREVLRTCAALRLGSVAIPALGTGTGGLDVGRCAAIVRDEVTRRGGDHPHPLRITVAVRSSAAHAAFVSVFTDPR